VTQLYSSERDSEKVVKFVSTLSKQARQDMDEAYRSERGTRMALTSLLWLPMNMQFIKAGS